MNRFVILFSLCVLIALYYVTAGRHFTTQGKVMRAAVLGALHKVQSQSQFLTNMTGVVDEVFTLESVTTASRTPFPSFVLPSDIFISEAPVLKGSTQLFCVVSYQSRAEALFGDSIRSLSSAEIDQLKKNFAYPSLDKLMQEGKTQFRNY